MLIGLAIFLFASIFEVRYLIVHQENKEAVIYLSITALAIGLYVYLMQTPKFYSFAHMMNDLFNSQ